MNVLEAGKMIKLKDLTRAKLWRLDNGQSQSLSKIAAVPIFKYLENRTMMHIG